jgi:glycosyltransferase involved in cell wall biosynthesis
MNILFFASSYYPHIGGVEKHLRELSKILSSDNNSVTIFVPTQSDDYPLYVQEYGFEIIRLKSSIIPFTSKIFIFLQFIKYITIFIKADIAHHHDNGTYWGLGRIARPLIKLFKIREYITFHGWEGNCPPDDRTVASRKKAEHAVIANLCVGHFIEKWYGTKADVIIYGGVEKKNLNECRSDDLVFVGRFDYDTGIWEYIKAWEIISKSSKNLKFILCGDGVYRQEIEGYIKEKQIINISILGFVSNPDIYVKNAAIVFTSGYLGILEAFSYKKNVISVYHNELKKDYLEMMPGSSNMMWLAQATEDVVDCFNEAIIDKKKKEAAYKFSLINSWEKVKDDYYCLWSIKKR